MFLLVVPGLIGVVIQIGHQVVESIGRIIPGSAFGGFQFMRCLFHDASPLLQDKEFLKLVRTKYEKIIAHGPDCARGIANIFCLIHNNGRNQKKGDGLVETVKLGIATEYIPGRVNVGLYVSDNGARLIDSGLDDEAGRKIARMLEERKIPLQRIVTTHSNADHCGGNAFLRKRTGCSVAATKLESVVIENPFLEPLVLWSAFPFGELENKFLQAKPSEVDLIIENSGIVDESGLEAVPLPGHFLDMIGVRTPDDVLFVADSVFSEELIEKYAVMFVLDVGAALETLDRLIRAEAAWFVPSHAPASENIVPLAEANRKGLLRVSEAVLESCGEPASREKILQSIAVRFSLSMSVSEYVLNSAAVGAHLSWLRKRGQVAPVVEKGVLLWRKTR